MFHQYIVYSLRQILWNHDRIIFCQSLFEGDYLQIMLQTKFDRALMMVWIMCFNSIDQRWPIVQRSHAPRMYIHNILLCYVEKSVQWINLLWSVEIMFIIHAIYSGFYLQAFLQTHTAIETHPNYKWEKNQQKHNTASAHETMFMFAFSGATLFNCVFN